ncbi:class I SAM-dependent methyltransferase [Anaerolinea thermophila]|uniref:class I SAM-dependent methyltransferase n=1 Tax=Anaerolinea thermophila TaxID=167964 RepID=UPI0026ED9862|nr:class I SAM-dependent methyltransferase [Anaerolinea thermophila]
MNTTPPLELRLLYPQNWKDYELLDCGNGYRLERFGPFRVVRPDAEAIWDPVLPEKEWKDIHARFVPSPEENGGHWEKIRLIPERWYIQYKNLKFWLQMGGSKHLGVFPEQSVQWEWIQDQITTFSHPVRVLNLFGYTGLSTLAAAESGASVTHVDASRKAISWARENQILSGLDHKPVRWLVDDALKFVQREARRGMTYEGIILDPPKFGRGPKGEVWEFYKLLPELLQACKTILSPKPCFIVLTAYAVKASAATMYYALEDIVKGKGGHLEAGEIALRENNKRARLLATALFARWTYQRGVEGL